MAAPRKTPRRPDIIPFMGDGPPKIPGKVTPHAGLRAFLGLHEKTPEAAAQEVGELMSKMIVVLEGTPDQKAKESKRFTLDEIECSLALNAEGQFYFIAKAGIEGGIKLTWKRSG